MKINKNENTEKQKVGSGENAIVFGEKSKDRLVENPQEIEKITRELSEEFSKPEPGKDSKIKNFVAPLRTYKDDLARALGKQKASIVSIVGSEEKRREREKLLYDKTPKKDYMEKRGIGAYAYIAIAIVVVAAAGALFFFYGKGEKTKSALTGVEKPLVFSDKTIEIRIGNLSGERIMQKLVLARDNASSDLGSIENLLLSKEISPPEKSGERRVVSSKEFLDAIGSGAPASFLRTLEPEFMLGIHIFDGNQPFLILKTNAYDRAFAGMLLWENILERDLSPLFGPSPEISLDGTKSGSASQTSFSDKIIRNKDTRALLGKDGKIEIVYTFIDPQTILITTNENTFAEIFSRMTASRVF